MPSLLRINSSARLSGSISGALADRVETNWRRANPDGTVSTRNLATNPAAPIEQATIEGFYAGDALTPEQVSATALSDRLIAELRSADALLIAAPIYNFGVPSALKAWIDQIVRIGHTFAYEDGVFEGLVPAKTAYVAVAYGAGGYLDGGPLAGADFVKPYLSFLLGFLGVEKVLITGAEATTADDATVAAQQARANGEIDGWFEQSLATA